MADYLYLVKPAPGGRMDIEAADYPTWPRDGGSLPLWCSEPSGWSDAEIEQLCSEATRRVMRGDGHRSAVVVEARFVELDEDMYRSEDPAVWAARWQPVRSLRFSVSPRGRG